MNKKSSLKTSDEFDDYPEITQTDIDQARFRVNLQDSPRKQRINIMLDTGVVAYFKAKAGKKGYQTLINEALKNSMHKDDLEETLRRVIREEIKSAA